MKLREWIQKTFRWRYPLTRDMSASACFREKILQNGAFAGYSGWLRALKQTKHRWQSTDATRRSFASTCSDNVTVQNRHRYLPVIIARWVRLMYWNQMQSRGACAYNTCLFAGTCLGSSADTWSGMFQLCRKDDVSWILHSLFYSHV